MCLTGTRRTVTNFLFCLASLTTTCSRAGTILFDAGKGQSAGNADWVIDADKRDLGTDSKTHLMVAGRGNESDPLRYPTPAVSTVTASTPETYWSGGLSAWGVALAKRAFGIETNTNSSTLTYGVTSNPNDLARFSAFVLVEPNIVYTAAQKSAIINYVRKGGGLIIIADHGNSDRNNDGVDSVGVLNDLFTNNGVQANPFGITFNGDDISMTSSYVGNASTNPIMRGPAGNVASIKYNGATTITIDPTKNSTVKPAAWSVSTKPNNKVLVAYATYGLGRVVAIGDSSAADDGTGDPNDTLYNGWFSAGNAAMILNATIWVAGSK